MKNLYILFISIISLTGCIDGDAGGLKPTMGYAPNIYNVHMSTMIGTDNGGSNSQYATIGQAVPDNATSEGMGGGSDYSPPDPGDNAPPGEGEPPGLPEG